MQMPSAVGVLGSAFTRTRSILSLRLGIGHAGKLLIVAALADPTILWCLIVPLQLVLAIRLAGLQSSLGAGDVRTLGTAVSLGLLSTFLLAPLLALIYLYGVCRLQATLFDRLSQRNQSIRAAWRRQGRSGLQYFALTLAAKVLVAFSMLALVGPILLRDVRTLIPNSGVSDVNQTLKSLIEPVGAIMFAGLLLWPFRLLIQALLDDFLLSSLVLEPSRMGRLPGSAEGAARSSILTAFRRLGGTAKNYPGQLLLFAATRTLVGALLSATLALMAAFVTGSVALFAWGMSELLQRVLASGSAIAHALFLILAGATAVVLASVYLASVITVLGVSAIWHASYAVLFYADRYPARAKTVGQAADRASRSPEPPAVMQAHRPIAARTAPDLW